MRLIRSWPKEIPEHRAYVEDDAERFVMEDFSYEGLGAIDDDILLLEWDVAVSKEDLAYFAATAARTPKDVLTTAYKLYFRGSKRLIWESRADRGGGLWSCVRDPGTMRYEPVETGAPTCHLFGLGMIYLPRDLVRQHAEHAARFAKMRFTDADFSLWHMHMVKRETPICWDVRPIHLHYDVADLLPSEHDIKTWVATS